MDPLTSRETTGRLVTSTTKTLKVAVFHTSDFETFPRGGGISVIREILRIAPEDDLRFTLFGVTPHKSEPLRRPSRRVIGGRSFDFVPLFCRRPETAVGRRPVVPLRIVSMMSYAYHRRWLRAAGYDVFYLHAPEAWPLIHCGVPTVYHVHGPQETAATYSRFRWVRTALFRSLYRHVIDDVITRPQHVIFIDTPTYETYSRRYPKHRNRFTLCSPSVNLDVFRPPDAASRIARRVALGIPINAPVILAVGRLSWVKGLDLLVQTLPAIRRSTPDVRLLIAGDGEERPALEALVAELELSSAVTFLGQQLEEAMPDLYGAADVLALPSRSESFGMVVLEALACGTPVVAQPVGVAAKIICDGQNGFVARTASPDALALALEEGLRLAAQSSVHARCRATVEALPQTGEQVAAILGSVAAGARPS
jgi:glycosyltransferase involved in cell wall biosynthesis